MSGFPKITIVFVTVFATLPGFLNALCAQLPNLDLETFGDYRNAIEATSEETLFLNIRWQSTLCQAVKQAAETEKPLLIYVMNGHPLACT